MCVHEPNGESWAVTGSRVWRVRLVCETAETRVWVWIRLPKASVWME